MQGGLLGLISRRLKLCGKQVQSRSRATALPCQKMMLLIRLVSITSCQGALARHPSLEADAPDTEFGRFGVLLSFGTCGPAGFRLQYQGGKCPNVGDHF